MAKLFLSVLIMLLSCMVSPTFAEALTLRTTAFLDQGILPVVYTCDGKDISPQLDWVNVPANTQSLALIVSDPDAPGGTFYHWVVYNIPTTLTAFSEGIDKLPVGVSVARNDFGKAQYSGPCPPKGNTHHYIFSIYALDTKLTFLTSPDGKTVMAAMQKHIIEKFDLTAIYSRWLQ